MNSEKLIKRDEKYILHTYARSPLALLRGEGMTAYDAEGKAYLDFTSGIGVNSLGFCHPAWTAAVAAQAGVLEDAQYGADILVTYRIPAGADEALRTALREASIGTIAPQLLEEIFCAG